MRMCGGRPSAKSRGVMPIFITLVELGMRCRLLKRIMPRWYTSSHLRIGWPCSITWTNNRPAWFGWMCTTSPPPVPTPAPSPRPSSHSLETSRDLPSLIHLVHHAETGWYLEIACFTYPPPPPTPPQPGTTHPFTPSTLTPHLHRLISSSPSPATAALRPLTWAAPRPSSCPSPPMAPSPQSTLLLLDSQGTGSWPKPISSASTSEATCHTRHTP
mmetsp:Transcript_53407/g.88721  ORF Transcript_53407/g.88721 Transcript_53407/m.88721 type:complete len:215 (+) Transcript_53407:470-1114(+)